MVATTTSTPSPAMVAKDAARSSDASVTTSGAVAASSTVIDVEQFFSQQARKLKNSILADLFQKFKLGSDFMVLHCGLPPAESFPLLSIDATISDVPSFTRAASARAAAAAGDGSSNGSSSDALTATSSGDEQPPPPRPLLIQPSVGSGLLPNQLSVSGQLVHDAQQYMFHSGHPPLLRWARTMAERIHQPPLPYECAISSGAVDAITATVACLCDPGDYILCEEYTYTHATECTFVPRGLRVLPVEADSRGMLPDSLRRVLAQTPPSPVTGKPPRVLYIIPNGQNPTGSVMTLQRKKEVYQICREHGIIILEDDAYFWLQFPHGASRWQEQPGLHLPPSFLSMDVDHRVLRVDTFSKLLGPGYRLGWITGAPKLVHKVAQQIQAGTCGPCSMTQVVVSQLLEGWGWDGFEAFVRRQQALYARRADAACRAAGRHLRGLCEWQETRAGMFMWLKLTALPDVDDALLNEFVQRRVAVLPGRAFHAGSANANADALLLPPTPPPQQQGAGTPPPPPQHAQWPCPYFRVTFSVVGEHQIDEAFERLGAGIRARLADLAGGPVPTVLPPPSAAAAVPNGAHEEDGAGGKGEATSAEAGVVVAHVKADAVTCS